MATDATLVETHDTPDHDTLVPDPQVQKEFGVTAMSIWRLGGTRVPETRPRGAACKTWRRSRGGTAMRRDRNRTRTSRLEGILPVSARLARSYYGERRPSVSR